MVVLSDKQNIVLEGLIAWMLKNRLKEHPAPAILAGYAGTGKTTLMVKFIEALEARGIKNVAVVTYTGKASDVVCKKMRENGLTSCYVGTIHSLFYKIKDIPLSAEESKDEDLDNDLEFERLSNDVINKGHDWDLIIVDELSMIDGDIMRDLLKYKAPVLFCGDTKQLTPINGTTADLLNKPTFMLEEVHRQAADNPIIKVATLVRNGEKVPYGVLGKKFIRVINRPEQTIPLADSFINKYFVNKDGSGVILCGENRIRHMFNNRVREKMGIKDEKYPQAGEILVCLKNDRTTGLKNGTLCLVSKKCVPSTQKYSEHKGELEVINLSSMQPIRAECHLGTFAGNFDFKDAKAHPEVLFFNYGYALTVHKSQGSEWDAVLLYNRRMQKQTPDEYQRWLYTGVTRASEKLIMIG